MAYVNSSFLNPKIDFKFNPVNNKVNSSGNNSPVGINDNPYSPTCADTESTLIENHHQMVENYVNQYGKTIAYQPIKYDFNVHNFIYGEDPISGYHYARKMKAIIDFKTYTTFLSKFGMMSDAELIIYIPIRHFEQVWGPSKGEIFPVAGDIFYIVDSACDRPLGQTPMIWEVSDKEDKINPTDFMGRHFYWKLTCKRFDYSYQPNAPKERFLDENVSDTDSHGRLPGGENPPDVTTNKDSVDEFAKNNFNQPETSVYGNYL